MSDDQQISAGREIAIYAYGNTADEIELDALDQAREFFGPDLQLEVRRSYSVSATGTNAPREKKFIARVTVKESTGG